MVEERVHRRLAAIVAADVVGYSHLMELDEAGTLTALKARRKAVLEPLVAKYRGRIFKVAGDGVLVEFGSAVDAVLCSIEVEIYEQEIARRQHFADDIRAGAFKLLLQEGATGEAVDISAQEIERNEQLIRMLQNLNAQLRAKIQQEGDED